MSRSDQTHRFSRPYWLLAAALLGQPTPAIAGTCPTSDDLKGGVVFERTWRDGTLNLLHQQIDDEIFWSSTDRPISVTNQRIYRTHFRGLLLLEERDGDVTTRKYTYDQDLSEIFPLKVGEVYNLSGSLTSENHGYDADLTVTLEIQGAKKSHLAGCFYDSFVVRLQQSAKDKNTGKFVPLSQSRFLYAPEISYSFGPVVKKKPFISVRLRTASDPFPD